MLSFSPDIRFCRNGHPMHAKRPLGDRIGRIGQVASPSSTSHVQFTRNRHTEHVSDTPDVRFTRNRQAQDKKCVLGDRFSRIGHPRRMKETWDLSDQIPNTHLKREPGRASAPDRRPSCAHGLPSHPRHVRTHRSSSSQRSRSA